MGGWSNRISPAGVKIYGSISSPGEGEHSFSGLITKVEKYFELLKRVE